MHTGFGAFLFVLPQALIGPYYPSSNRLSNSSFKEQDLCTLKSDNGDLGDVCVSTYSSEWYYMMLFVVGQLLMGAGTTPLYSLGPAYLDENVHPKNMPIYLGFWFASSILGPGMGFILGGAMLSIFVDIKQVSETSLDWADPFPYAAQIPIPPSLDNRTPNHFVLLGGGGGGASKK